VLKQVLFLLHFIVLPVLLSAQQTDSVLFKQTDSNITKKSDKTIVANADKVLGNNGDSIFVTKDTTVSSLSSHETTIQKIVKDNEFLNSSGEPFAMVIYPRKQSLQDTIFYTILIIVALLAFFRFFYIRYFNNLFRVFFNTSLRQSQLTDQLLQAKLPSLFFNLIFVISGGLFIYFLLQYFGRISESNPLALISICSLGVAAIYLLKFITLKFTGWITGYKEITNTYIFIIFLINKILGILLLPLIIMMAFSIPFLIKTSTLIAILLTALMFFLRFSRSYGLLHHQLKISRPQFFLYIVGIEIMPVLLIYKGLMLLLSKNI